MFSQGNGDQYGLTVIECCLIFHAMVLHEKYTVLMSQKQKYCYHLENVQTQTMVTVLYCIHSLFSVKSNKIIKIIHAYIKLHNKYNN